MITPRMRAPMASATPQSPPSPDTRDVRRVLLVTFRKQQALQQERAIKELFGHLIQGVGRGDLGLPAIPSAAAELDALLREDERSTQDLVALVDGHPELQAEVARTAGGPQAPDTARQLARLGLDRLWRLSLHQILTSAAFELAEWQPEIDELRSDLLAVADAAHQATGSLRGTLYSASLLHGIGKLVLIHAAARAGADRDAVEELDRAHGAQLGMVLLERWGFSSEIAQAVGFQDHHSQLPEPARTVAEQVRGCRRNALGR